MIKRMILFTILVIASTQVQSYTPITNFPTNVSLLLAKLSVKRPPLLGLPVMKGLNNTSSTECKKYLHLGSDHTMCKYQSKACPNFKLVRSGDLSCADKIQIVQFHNDLRQNVSLGRVPGQPWAQNMVKMVWDDELAMIAQRWADQCHFGHDVNPNVPRFMVGQNIYLFNVSTYETDQEPRFKQGILRWFAEYTEFPGAVDPFVYQSETGHYTQLAWGATSAIGCGYTMYTGNKQQCTVKLHVCNYGTHGNTLGGKMYTVGKRNCDKYVNLSNSTSHPGLCDLKISQAKGVQCIPDSNNTKKILPLHDNVEQIHLIA